MISRAGVCRMPRTRDTALGGGLETCCNKLPPSIPLMITKNQYYVFETPKSAKVVKVLEIYSGVKINGKTPVRILREGEEMIVTDDQLRPKTKEEIAMGTVENPRTRSIKRQQDAFDAELLEAVASAGGSIKVSELAKALGWEPVKTVAVCSRLKNQGRMSMQLVEPEKGKPYSIVSVEVPEEP